MADEPPRKLSSAILKSGIAPPLIIFLIALAFRGIYLYDVSDNPTFKVPIVDSLTYDRLGRNIAEGAGINKNFFWHPVFYPSFLAV